MFIYPSGTKNITSPYRPSHRPNHNGIDFSGGRSIPIVASASGTVSKSYRSSSFGEVVFIKHNLEGTTYETVYAHMVTGSRLVTKGNKVRQGQKLGMMGTTGQSTGIHLHFELHIPRWISGSISSVDPLPFLKGMGEIPEIDLICSNKRLTRDEMYGNAQFVAHYLINQDWTPESIAGILGNMESESTINACRWQGGNKGDMSGGYGLVQWTPATNYINWAESEGLEVGNTVSQLSRILYEVDNNVQWIATGNYNYSFKEFTQNSGSPKNLASAFLKNYERAGVEVEAERRENAMYWYGLLDFSGADLDYGDTEAEIIKERRHNFIRMLMSGALNGW